MNQTRNPYAPPNAPVADLAAPAGELESLIDNGRLVPVGHCTDWIKQSFELFFQNSWKWIGTMLLLLVLAMLASLIPYSTLLTTILFPVVVGGIARALESQRRTRRFSLNDIFSGFGPSLRALAAIGCVSFLSYGVMFVVLYVMVGTDAALAVAFQVGDLGTIPPNFWSATLLSMVLTLPFTAATFLAAPLVMLHGISPMRAMQMSFFGCFKNIVPWILCGVLMLLIVAVSVLPLLLGLFITGPTAMLMFYPIYRDLFVVQESAS